ncbi:MAG: 2-polyprenylphenol 6-hydroxylase [Pseudomonadota bacterium]
MILDAPAQLWRLLRTGATFERTGAMRELLDALGLKGWPRFLIRAIARPFGMFGRTGDPDLPPVARALQAMGPAYVKFGQILSTRPDVAGERIVEQLRYLQDRLPPFPVEDARKIIEGELGARTDALIAELGPPVAAASIAQVHPARWLPTGEKVAVKVLRPNVARLFRRDIGTFYFIAGAVEAIVPATARLRPRAVVQHFEGVVNTELDLRLEASSASEFADNALEEDRIRIPKVYWEGTGRRIFTMAWADGLPLDADALTAAGLDTAKIGRRVIQVFLRHALVDGFFHADMHQGNLRMLPDGTMVILDYGIMGRLDPVTRRHYAEILYGFLTRDYRRVAEVHFEAGYVPPDRDVDAFAQALRSIGEPIFGQDVSQISMARLLAYLFETTERFGMATRTELILLQRTMVVVEGVARSIDPHANIFEAARPVVETWIRRNMGPAQVARDIGDTLTVLRRLGPRLPGLADEVLLLAEEARSRRLAGPLAVNVRSLPAGSPRRPLVLAFLVGALAAGVAMWALLTL